MCWEGWVGVVCLQWWGRGGAEVGVERESGGMHGGSHALIWESHAGIPNMPALIWAWKESRMP